MDSVAPSSLQTLAYSELSFPRNTLVKPPFSWLQSLVLPTSVSRAGIRDHDLGKVLHARAHMFFQFLHRLGWSPRGPLDCTPPRRGLRAIPVRSPLRPASSHSVAAAPGAVTHPFTWTRCRRCRSGACPARLRGRGTGTSARQPAGGRGTSQPSAPAPLRRGNRSRHAFITQARTQGHALLGHGGRWRRPCGSRPGHNPRGRPPASTSWWGCREGAGAEVQDKVNQTRQIAHNSRHAFPGPSSRRAAPERSAYKTSGLLSRWRASE